MESVLTTDFEEIDNVDHIDNYTEQFRDTVVTQLAELNKGQDEIVRRLDKINGSVGELRQKAADNERAILSHPLNCPQAAVLKMQEERIDDVNERLATGDHPGSTEWRNRIIELERKAAISQAAKDVLDKEQLKEISNKDKILDRIVFPLARTLGIGLLILFLLHANDILARLK